MKSILKLIHKIRSSFTIQLTIWVAGGVLVISAVVIILLARYSQQVIKDESLETSKQLLENMAVRINNELRQADISARLEHRVFKVTKPLIEKLIEENNQMTAIKQSLPHIQLYVVESDAADAADPLQQDGQQVFTFQEEIYNKQFSIVAICPASDLYDKYADMQVYLLLRGIIGVLVLLFILWKVIARHLRPLHVLADSAQRIADRHLDETIPDTHHQDEIGQLQNSLSKMQHSLADYMEEMRQKQDTLNRQNAELQEAYSEAQEYERVKDKFIHDMTDQLAQPVDTVCRNTYSICADYKTMAKAEMAKKQINILQATETITSLLDQSFTAAK
jgi:methyl-accepting chemotaxis protein